MSNNDHCIFTFVVTDVDYLRVHWSQFIAEMQEWQQLSVEIKMAV